MPSDVGRSWDDLVRRHWKDLWSSDPRQAGRARAAFRLFLAAIHEELGHHRRAIEEIRGAPARAPPPVAAKVPVPTRVPAPTKVRSPPPPPPALTMAPAVLEPRAIDALARSLGHRFHNPRLLEEALAHPSYTNEKPEIGLPSNYRMAYLGDALLGFLIADILYATAPGADQAVLTEGRKRLVSRPALGRTAARLGVGEYLLIGGGLGPEGRKNPTILAETLEALVAAIYVDGGLEAARAFVLNLFGVELRTPATARPPRPRQRGRSRRRGVSRGLPPTRKR